MAKGKAEEPVNLPEIAGLPITTHLTNSINYFAAKHKREKGEVVELIKADQDLLEKFLDRKSDSRFVGTVNGYWPEFRKFMNNIGWGSMAKLPGLPKIDEERAECLAILWLSERLRFKGLQEAWSSYAVSERVASMKISHAGVYEAQIALIVSRDYLAREGQAEIISALEAKKSTGNELPISVKRTETVPELAEEKQSLIEPASEQAQNNAAGGQKGVLARTIDCLKRIFAK